MLFACKDQVLLIWGDAFLESDGLARQSFDKDLQASTHTKEQVLRTKICQGLVARRRRRILIASEKFMHNGIVQT